MRTQSIVETYHFNALSLSYAIVLVQLPDPSANLPIEAYHVLVTHDGKESMLVDVSGLTSMSTYDSAEHLILIDLERRT